MSGPSTTSATCTSIKSNSWCSATATSRSAKRSWNSSTPTWPISTSATRTSPPKTHKGPGRRRGQPVLPLLRDRDRPDRHPRGGAAQARVQRDRAPCDVLPHRGPVRDAARRVPGGGPAHRLCRRDPRALPVRRDAPERQRGRLLSAAVPRGDGTRLAGPGRGRLHRERGGAAGGGGREGGGEGKRV